MIPITNEILFFGHVLFLLTLLFLAAWHSREALLSLICVQLIIANFFVTKQIMLFGIATTGSEVFLVSGMYGISLIYEFYGAKEAQRAVWVSFTFLLFFLITAQLHALYAVPSLVDQTRIESFKVIAGFTPGLVLASLLAYICSERIHLWLYAVLKGGSRHPLLRHLIIFVAQLCDTTVFGLVGLWGVMKHLEQIILFSMVIKLLVIVMMAPLMSVFIKLLVLSGREQYSCED